MSLKCLFAIIFILLLVAPVLAVNKVDLYFFTVPGCSHCANLREWFDAIKPDYPTLNIIEINGAQNQEQFKQFLQDYNASTETWGQVPRVFIGNYTCLGDTPCIGTLEDKIKYCLDNKCEIINASSVQEEIDASKLIAMFAATDAVSPCALAVLTLLLAVIMLKNPEQKRKVLYAGLAFALGIFLIYFTVGLFIILGFKSILAITNFDKSFFNTLIGLFAIFIGLLNLKDFIWKSKSHEIPMSWRPKMQEIVKKTASVPGAFAVGLLVAFFLTPCTIGPYFVAGSILSDMNLIISIPLLLLYNLIFILPMVVMTFIIYSGKISIEKAAEWRESKRRWMHLLIAILMFALGGSMLIGWI